MPYVFECPQCHEKNYGFQTPPTANAEGSFNYFDNLTCARCGVAGLYWVANERGAQALGQGQPPVLRNRIAIGVQQSDIGWFDPQGRAEIQKEVVNLLRGCATMDASFSQGQRRKELLPTRLDVAEGLCEGMSLHWIRRVLQGGKTTYKVDKRKSAIERSDAVMLTKLKRQLTVGANVQVTEVRQEWTDAYLTGLGFTKSGTLWSIPSTLADLWEQTKTKGKYAKHWAELSREYDRQLNVGGRQSSRPLSNVVAISSTVRSAQSLGTFAAGLCRDPAFRVGTAALLSVGLRLGVGEAGGAISGHAIAAYVRSDTEHYLFDPNIGVFVCTTRDNLRRAIELLIGTGWTTRMNWILEGTYGYSLFQARSSPTSVQARERPLQMTPSPQSTAIENQDLLPAVMPRGHTQQRPASPPVQATPPVTPTTRPEVTPSRPAVGGAVTGGGPFRPQGAAQPGVTAGAGTPRQQLKAQLEQVRDEPARQLAGAWGTHDSVEGGWVKVPFTLVQKIREARLTNSEVVKVGPNGAFAIAKEHINQLIAMI